MAKRTSRRRAAKPRVSPLAHIPFRNIQIPFPPVERITQAEVETLHDASMQILEEIGIAYMDDEALDLWEKAGADVDRTSQMVKVDRTMIMDLIGKAPSTFTWRARNPQHDVIIGGNYIAFSPNGGTVFYQDLDTERRPGLMSDYEVFLKINQSSGVVHFAGEQLIVPHDVEVSYRHLDMGYAALTLTDKAFMSQAHGRIITKDAVDMAKIVFGDDYSDGERPVVGGVINASSPLRYDDRMIGGMLAYAEAKQALIMTPFVLAGAMSPITMASAVTQQNAEALSGIAFCQLVNPGTPCIYGGFATNIDMKTGSPAFGTPEGAWAHLVGPQMARYYGLPFRGSGGLNTSKVADAQAAYETLWSMWPVVLGHNNFMNHCISWLDGGLVASPVKAMVDMESLAMFQRFLAPFEISPETLAIDKIAEIGPGGHHFGTDHTQARYSTEFYANILSTRQNQQTWALQGAEDAATRAHKLWQEVVTTYEKPALDAAILEELDAYVAKRKEDLKGVELYR